MTSVKFSDYVVGPQEKLLLIAGPCVIESEEMVMRTAEALVSATDGMPLQFVFKSSYKKANRTSLNGFSGLPFEEALGILRKVKETFHVPVLTDIHTEQEVSAVADVADVLQIPAFLCRQTDLLLAAGNSGRVVNIKKGQFLSPEGMQHAAEKVKSTGNGSIMLTERGSTFGYSDLVVDMRGLITMAGTGYPVVFDATHSVQIPGGKSSTSGGRPEFIVPLARAALATGAVSGIFMEAHPDPANAFSDAGSQLNLELVPRALQEMMLIHTASQELRK